jgi:hypothetical protein
MNLSAIKQEIYIKLDEILPPGGALSHPFESSMNSALDDAYRQFLKECPVSLLPMDELTETIVFEESNELAFIPCPDDFVRVGLFKFSDWVNPATKHITVDHPDYKLIQNGAISGSVITPVVLLIHAMKGSDTAPQRYLQCLKVLTDDSEEYLYYIKYVQDGASLLSDQCIPGLTWLATANLMQIFKLNDPLKLALERYKSFILSNLR